MPPLGIIVNPRAGSDVRRVLASASTTTLEEKISIVRRVVLGAADVGVERFIVNHDPHEIARRATETLSGLDIDIVHRDLHFTEQDTMVVAGMQRDAGCGAVVTLGGDGTNRAAMVGWPEMPVLPISTGTNNAFPQFIEPTVAGSAAGLVATGAVDAAGAVDVSPLIRVESSSLDDVALVDVVVTDDPYVGSLELFDPATLRLVVLSRSNPTAMGFASVAARLGCEGRAVVRFCSPTDAEQCVRVATAPGHHSDLGVESVSTLGDDDTVEYDRGGVIAYDGERMRRVEPGDGLRIRVVTDGPRVVDPARVMRLAASHGLFATPGPARD